MKKYILLIAVIAALGSSGCKNWMNINQNPNDASSSVITMDLLLPAAEYMVLNNHINSTYSVQLFRAACPVSDQIRRIFRKLSDAFRRHHAAEHGQLVGALLSNEQQPEINL